MKQIERVVLVLLVLSKMRTYHFLYTIDNQEYQVEINAKNATEALKIMEKVCPEATCITFLTYNESRQC